MPVVARYVVVLGWLALEVPTLFVFWGPGSASIPVRAVAQFGAYRGWRTQDILCLVAS